MPIAGARRAGRAHAAATETDQEHDDSEHRGDEDDEHARTVLAADLAADAFAPRAAQAQAVAGDVDAGRAAGRAAGIGNALCVRARARTLARALCDACEWEVRGEEGGGAQCVSE